MVASSYKRKFDQSLQLLKVNNVKEAKTILKELVKKSPQPFALNVLGQILQAENRHTEALKHLTSSYKINPNDHTVATLIARSYADMGKYKKAIGIITDLLEKFPGNADFWYKKGKFFSEIFYYCEAIECYQKALEINEMNANYHYSLAFAFDMLGLTENAIKAYSKATTLDPQNPEYLMHLIYCSYRYEKCGYESHYKLSKEYKKSFIDKPIEEKGLHPSYYNFEKRELKVGKKLKIGFVSCDFYDHPIMQSLYGLFEQLSEDKDFELYFYSTGHADDDITKKIKGLSTNYKLRNKSKFNELADEIYQDEVDILFEITGYDNHKFLPLFRLKPAPMQVSYIGWWGTYAMEEMDYMLTDKILIQDEKEEKYYSETVFHMEEGMAATTPYNLPEINREIPYDRNGYITFGSMNKFHKINQNVIAVWSRILQEVPNSKLLIDARTISAPSSKKLIKEQFGFHGITDDRLIIRDSYERETFLESYNDIDIALNPFPFSGGVSSIEALAMAVPVVNFEFPSFPGRLGATTLLGIGLDQFSTKNMQEYMQIAIGLANDIEKLRDYRQNLDTYIGKSNKNISTFYSAFKKSLFQMWEDTINKVSN